MNFIYVTMWGLQFFPWLLPNLTVTISCSVPGFPVWPEAWAGELWSCQSHLRAVWFDCHCGGRETVQIMALPLHLWRKFPVPLDRISLSIVLRPLHQVTLCSPSLTFPRNAWPTDWWGVGDCRLGGGGSGAPALLLEELFHCGFQSAYQSISCLFKCSGEHLKNLPSKQPALFLLRF